MLSRISQMKLTSKKKIVNDLVDKLMGEDHPPGADGKYAYSDNEADWFNIARGAGAVEMEKEEFIATYGEGGPKCIPGDKICHLKGFGRGMQEVYDEEILAKLKNMQMLVWDGDDPDIIEGRSQGSFTRLITKFLDYTEGTTIVSFKKRYKTVKDPKYSWAPIMEKYPGRVVVVPINLHKDTIDMGVDTELHLVKDLPSWAAQFFALGRIAAKITKAKHGVSMGGGGISANEVKCALKTGEVTWTIYELSRGEDEAYPTLCDFIKGYLEKNPKEKNLTLVRGKDPTKVQAYLA